MREKCGRERTQADEAKPPKTCLERPAGLRATQCQRLAEEAQRRIARLHPWSKRRRVESAREAEMERGKAGAECQVLCKSASLGGVTSVQRPTQQLTKDTRLRTASSASDTRLSKPAERD